MTAKELTFVFYKARQLTKKKHEDLLSKRSTHEPV